jgi:hypothetical protein
MLFLNLVCLTVGLACFELFGSSCDATSSKLLEDFESDEWWAYLDYKYMKARPTVRQTIIINNIRPTN